MRIYVGSDSHGSSPDIDKFFSIVDEYRLAHPDTKAVLLGDIYNHGPRNPLPNGYAPMKVAERLNDEKDNITVIQGNCDSEVDQMISDFEIKHDFFMQWGARRLYFTHGHKCNPDLPLKDAIKGDIVFYGHFHRAAVEEVDGVIYVCVGALGMPKPDTVRSYAVIDDNKVCVKSLYDDKILFEFDI